MIIRKIFHIGLSVILLSTLMTCVKKIMPDEENMMGVAGPSTRVKISNQNGTSIVRVNIVSADPAQNASFDNVPQNSSSNYQIIRFDSYGGVAVSCPNGGCLSGNVILNRNTDNTISLQTGLEPAANPDTNLPTVTAFSPNDNGAMNVASNAAITVTFSEPMFTTSVIANANITDTTCTGTIQISTGGTFGANTCVRMASLTASADNRSFTATPAGGLAFSTFYKVRVTTAAQDKTGDSMAGVVTMVNGFTTGAAPDTTAPDPVTLTSPAQTETSIDLAWTAAGDDGAVGNATNCSLRYSTIPFTSANFGIMGEARNNGVPFACSPVATNRTFTANILQPGTYYYFMYRICDEANNCSYSNNNASLAVQTAGVAPAGW